MEIGRVSIATAGNVDTALPVRIGRDGNNGFAWNQGSYIDELKVWRRALSPAEVVAEFKGSDPTAAFNTWMEYQASLRAYPGTATTPTDDPDGDGSSNLLEYAAGTSPFSPTEFPKLVAEMFPGGLRVRFTQRDGGTGIHGTDAAYRASGLRYSLARSDSLDSDWLPVQGSATQADPASMADKGHRRNRGRYRLRGWTRILPAQGGVRYPLRHLRRSRRSRRPHRWPVTISCKFANESCDGSIDLPT